MSLKEIKQYTKNRMLAIKLAEELERLTSKPLNGEKYYSIEDSFKELLDKHGYSNKKYNL